MRKTYFLAPSWGISPAQVALGSVIANVKSPQNPLSETTLTEQIDTPVLLPFEERPISGTVKNSKEWSIGLFATFIQVITLGGEASVSSKSSTQIDYSCELMTTHQFAPSLNYISKAAEDPRVKEHLKMGGIGAKAFVITGIKTVENVTITTSEETEREQTLQIGVDIPPAQITLGPKGTYKSTKSNQSTRTIEGPIVFAFQVEKIRVSRKGNVSHKEHIVGAMLGRKEGGESELVIERAGSELDEDDLDDFDLTVRSGVKDEAGESCDVIVP